MRHAWMQVVVGTVALTVAQVALSFLVPAAPKPVDGGFALLLLSNALTVSVLVAITRRLHAEGWRRALVLWTVWGGLQAISLLEVFLFDINLPRRDVPWLMAHALAVSACFSLFAAFAFRGDPAPRPEPPMDGAPSWWRLAAGDLIYVVLYSAAGMLAWPYLRAFYEQHPMPAVREVIALQLVRGLMLTGIVLLMMRQLRMTRRRAAVLAGVAMSLLGGVAALLVPNPYLPEAVRLAHLPEVGVSNFLFGLIVGLLLSAGAAGRRARAVDRSLSATSPSAPA